MARGKGAGFGMLGVLAFLAGFFVSPGEPTLAVGQQPGQQPEPPPAEQQLAPEALDKLLAPIALYPDALLARILVCSTSPYQVRAVDEWLKKNQNLKGSELQEAAQKEEFDPSYVALVPFAQVVNMMAEQIDWTRQLGCNTPQTSLPFAA